MAWRPRFDLGRWSGGDIDGSRDCEGWSLVIQWFNLIVELGIGRIKP